MPTTVAASPAPLSLTARLTGVFATPADVFDSVKTSPPSIANWLLPMILLIAVSWISAAIILSQPVFQRQLTEIQTQAIEKQIAARNVPPQQAEAMRQAAEKFGAIGTKIGMIAAPALMAATMPFWWGLLLWAIGRLVFKARFGYMQATEVAGLSGMISLLGTVVKTLLILGTGNLMAGANALLFAKDADPTSPLFQVLAVLDVFVIWVLAARAVGLARLAGVSVGRAAAWVFGVWISYTGLLLGVSWGAQALAKAVTPH